jgi:hypothetical protein
MVEAIPKSTSSVIHPDALRFDVAVAVSADMSGDYRQPVGTQVSYDQLVMKQPPKKPCEL